MAELPHMPMSTDAYLADTRHLTTLQHGAYLLLLMTAWRCRGRPQLPDDERILARYAGLDLRTWRRIGPEVMAMWDLGEDGFWTQAKQLKVRDVVNKNVEQQRNKAARRWGRNPSEDNESSDAVASAGHMPDGCQPKPKPSLPPKPPKGEHARDGYGNPFDPLFADFVSSIWAKRWPREGHNRPKAFKAYSRLSEADRLAAAGKIERAAQRFVTTRPDPIFRPMLQSWLNGRGWEEDEAPAVDTPQVPWAKWVAAFRASGDWNDLALGPAPGRPGCRVPAEFLIGLVA